MNKAAVAEAAAGSPPFYFFFLEKISKELEVGGERWEEFLIFHIQPLSLLIKNEVDIPHITLKSTSCIS